VDRQERATEPNPEPRDRIILIRLLAIAFVTATAIGAFEVGLALRGKAVDLDAYQIGMMFMECSLVMFVAQGLIFSPFIKPESTRWLFAPGLAALAAGLAAVPFATSYLALVLAVGLVAASAGILSPIVAYWISLGAHESQGTKLGLQTAAASLGQTLGSAIGGLLFDIAFPGTSFIVPAVMALAALVAAFGLPRLLNPPKTELQAALCLASTAPRGMAEVRKKTP
jgi:MFS family permease